MRASSHVRKEMGVAGTPVTPSSLPPKITLSRLKHKGPLRVWLFFSETVSVKSTPVPPVAVPRLDHCFVESQFMNMPQPACLCACFWMRGTIPSFMLTMSSAAVNIPYVSLVHVCVHFCCMCWHGFSQK